ncbi:hypothetical protein BDV3_001665 [Batrachochytrium dendrobatidis]
MHKVSILGTESIVVGKGIVGHIAADVVSCIPASTYAIITDENLAKLHLDELLAAFQREIANQTAATASKSRILSVVIPAGEVHKTRDTKASIEDWLLSQACTRDSCLIALGGGVLGDLVGFVAATFMRGVPVVQIPTTLLAMVDSSVGGKTAVDTPNGKNLIGAFHQPRRIFIDIQYLTTLNKREFVNGLAEVIKTAAIWDEKDFQMLENHSDRILGLVGSDSNQDQESMDLVTRLILGSIKVKAHVVTVDEKETGLRGLLNFGHTIGHAIEAIAFPHLLHGECVAIGMVKEAEVSRFLGHLNNVSVGRLVRCLRAYGLPVSLNDPLVSTRCPNKTFPTHRLLDIMRVDKKNQGDKKRIVLLSALGATVEPRASFVADDVIQKIISPAVLVTPSNTKLNVSLAIPGSKSISNRALVMAALGKGVCRLHGLLHSDDVQVMLDALQKLVGISYTWENKGETLVVNGGGGKLRSPQSELYLGNAGTASRFLTTVCTLIKSSAINVESAVLTGNARMKQRPIGPLVDALVDNHCDIQYLGTKGCLPISIKSSPTGLSGGTIHLSASVSSQYVSSILISAPYASSPVTLDLDGDAVVSQPYIDMTIAMMKSFGIHVTRIPGTNKYNIPQGIYTNPTEYMVEADASSATYPLAFAAITGSTVTVTNIGSNSLQGDAMFAIRVLKEMGCSVHQTETTTTVQGPEQLVPLPCIDMETMTDAFMTATVLAAVAQSNGNVDDNTTRITGIANQRVKECDRIAAMIQQLDLFGVCASELPDGIQIHGMDRSKLCHTKPLSGVHCFDDHRIAMSFSILACAVDSKHNTGVVITERECVEKTWPSWWDTLENTLGTKITGVDLPKHMHASKLHTTTESAACFHSSQISQSSILLVGMRGVGKTHMGRAAAKHFGRTFIDMDVYLEQKLLTTIPELIKAQGWEGFRTQELQCLQDILVTYPTGAVIASGGGIVETPDARSALENWSGTVIHIRRDIDEVEAYLGVDTTRPSFGQDVRSVFARRAPLYTECSSAEFVIPTSLNQANAAYWNKVEQSFMQFLHFKLATTKPNVNDKSLDTSYFVSLTFPNVVSAAALVEQVTEGANAIELRVDLLESTKPDFVGSQVAMLRHLSKLPIVYTVRTQSQGGRFPDDKTRDMISLLELGIRLGCEYIDVEFTAPFERFSSITKSKGNSLIIGSYHDCRGVALWTDGHTATRITGTVVSMADKEQSVKRQCREPTPVCMLDIYQDLYAHSDCIKLIGVAHNIADSIAVSTFRNQFVPKLGLAPKPLIALVMGPLGQLSRVLNTYLTPVTHASMPMLAAPGQLTISQIHSIRHLIGMLPKKEYYLFGKPISESMSPVLHNTGFKQLGLPHHYSLLETDSIDRVREVVQQGKLDGTFGGASVTIPLKIDVIQSGIATRICSAAKQIGAVNTLHMQADGEIVGHNTDWIGIKQCIQRHLGVSCSRKVVGIVLGAGGTARAACYALSQISYIQQVRVWNRTVHKAAEMAKEFKYVAVEELKYLVPIAEPMEDEQPLYAIVGTIPSTAQDALDLDSLFKDGVGGVVVEMAYRPRQTKLIMAAQHANQKHSSTFACVEGIDVLIEQGYEQFQLWTGCHPPHAVMSEAVYTNYR